MLGWTVELDDELRLMLEERDEVDGGLILLLLLLV